MNRLNLIGRNVKLVATSLAMLVGGIGCASKPPPPPFVAPSARTELTHFAGTALSGPTTRPIASVAPVDALAVRVRAVALEHGSATGQSLAGAARLIAADRLGTPVLPSNRLTRSGRLVELKDPAAFDSAVVAPTGGRAAELWRAEGAVSNGTTAAFTIADPKSIELQVAGAPAEPRIELYVSRPGGPKPAPATQGIAAVPVNVAIVVQGLAPPPADPDRPSDEKQSSPMFVQREAALLERKVGERDVFVVTLPFTFSSAAGQSPAQSIALVIDLARDVGSPAHIEAMSRAVEDGRKSAERMRTTPTDLGSDRPEAAGLSAAFDALSNANSARRASLVYLAGQAGARLTEDIALVADDGTLVNLLTFIRSNVPGAGNPSSRPSHSNLAAFGWQLDRATFNFLGQLVSANKLPMELNAALSVHTGEAGRHAGSFEEVGKNANSRADFEARLVAENLIYLEDSSPSPRVRAFDWLKLRNQAPAGFDPLGSPKDRRAALDQAANAPAAPATAAPGGNP